MKKMAVWLSPVLAGVLAGSGMGVEPGEEATASGWQMADGGIYRRNPVGCRDHLAMAGRAMDVILEWQVDEDGRFSAVRAARFPMLRTLPDNTHAALSVAFDDAALPPVECDRQPLKPGRVGEIRIRGRFEVVSRHGDDVTSRRVIFPALNVPALLELVTLENGAGRPLEITVPAYDSATDTAPGVFGVYTVRTNIIGDGTYRLAPGAALSYWVVRSARLAEEPPYFADALPELAAREALTAATFRELRLETPDEALNLMFDFAKFHAVESIFATRGGLLHGPGGYNRYLAAIWANDEAEYANPFFPFLGDAAGNQSALNAFRHFAGYMNEEYRPIPSSIVAEGRGNWHGAGDRGDMAMIAHGAARFALASGNPAWGRELLPLITWSLEYCRRQLTPEGVVASDSDELEGRFPAGKANLCTAMLYFDGLERAADLLEALQEQPEKAGEYRRQAAALKRAVESFFAAEVEGFETYRYYEGNTTLRSWICMPLVFGFEDRAPETVAALFSDRLWLGDGLLTASGTETYWDRSALYAFRGILFCGFLEEALPRLIAYTRSRLLGKHVPYPVEAYPEGNQSQLSAESALYCRIFTEGLFGIVPTGFRQFSLKAQLPAAWDRAALRRIHAFGTVFDLQLRRVEAGIEVIITDESGAVPFRETVREGTALEVKL